MRFLDTPGSERPRFPQQNAPLDAIGRCRNGGNRPFNQGVAGSIPARPTNRINSLRRSRVRRNLGVSLSRSLSSFVSIPYGQWFRSDLQSVPQHSVLDMGTFANSTVLLNGGAGGATSPLGPLGPLAVFRLSAYAVCGGGIRVGSGGGPACPSVGAWLCLHSGMSLCVLAPLFCVVTYREGGINAKRTTGTMAAGRR